MADYEKPRTAKQITAEMEMIERATNRLHGYSEDLAEGAKQFRKDLEDSDGTGIRRGSQEDVFLRSAAIIDEKRRSYRDTHGIQLGTQEDVFLRSAMINESRRQEHRGAYGVQLDTQEDVFLRSAAIEVSRRRPDREEYVHMLADLISDGLISFYHRGNNITPRRSICDAPVPYLHTSEKGFETFIDEVNLAIASNSSYPGFVITGEGVEHLFSNHQNMLHTASMLTNWFERAPVHINYDLDAFRALEYDSSPTFFFSLLTSSIAEQAWHTKMMLERNGKYGKKWTPDIEWHRAAYWETVRDFPIGNRHDLARLSDEARCQLQQYPALLAGVVDSLTGVIVHLPH